MNAYNSNSLRARRPAKPKGFTLVELMVTILVVAILAAIAIPSYSRYTLKAHRTEAKSALLDLASLEERYFSVNNTYSITPSDMGYSGSTPFVTTAPVPVGNSYYQITAWTMVAATAPTAALPSGAPATYSITLSTMGTQQNDTACATFSINSAGVQSATGTDPNASIDCWQ